MAVSVLDYFPKGTSTHTVIPVGLNFISIRHVGYKIIFCPFLNKCFYFSYKTVFGPNSTLNKQCLLFLLKREKSKWTTLALNYHETNSIPGGWLDSLAVASPPVNCGGSGRTVQSSTTVMMRVRTVGYFQSDINLVIKWLLFVKRVIYIYNHVGMQGKYLLTAQLPSLEIGILKQLKISIFMERSSKCINVSCSTIYCALTSKTFLLPPWNKAIGSFWSSFFYVTPLNFKECLWWGRALSFLPCIFIIYLTN